MQLDSEELLQKLAMLTLEHRELDKKINKLQQQPQYDQFDVLRMKKRKLLLKDMMMRISSQLIPDLNA